MYVLQCTSVPTSVPTSSNFPIFLPRPRLGPFSCQGCNGSKSAEIVLPTMCFQKLNFGLKGGNLKKSREEIDIFLKKIASNNNDNEREIKFAFGK